MPRRRPHDDRLAQGQGDCEARKPTVYRAVNALGPASSSRRRARGHYVAPSPVPARRARPRVHAALYNEPASAYDRLPGGTGSCSASSSWPWRWPRRAASTSCSSASAAIVLSVLNLVGLGGPLWVQLMLFSVIAVGSLLLFRNPLLRLAAARSAGRAGGLARRRRGGPARGDRARRGGPGRAARHGLVGAEPRRLAPVVRGERCRVVTVDRLMILIEPEGAR